MKSSRNILSFLALNRFIARDEKLKSKSGELYCNLPVLNISNQAFISFFNHLVNHEIRFLITGGVAAAYHGDIQVATTIDIWLSAGKENIEKLRKAIKIPKNKGLSSLTAVEIKPLVSEKFKLLISKNLFHLKSKDFDECYRAREHVVLEGTSIPILNLTHLLVEKMSLRHVEEKLASGERMSKYNFS